MRGVWILYSPDLSTFTLFSSEIEAVRSQVGKPTLKVGFVPYGTAITKNALPADRPPKRETAES